MTICLLAHNLRVYGGFTIGHVVTSRLPALLPEAEFLISVPKAADYSGAARFPNVELRSFRGGGIVERLIWEMGVLAPAVKAFRPDWVWGLGNLGLLKASGRQSLLLHDPHLIYRVGRYGDVGAGYRLKKWLLKQRFRRGLKFTDRVYTQTETIRQRLYGQYGFPLERIHLFSPAYLEREEAKMPAPSGMAGGPGDFKLLYVSAPWGHKSHRILIETFRRHRERLAGVRCFITVDPGFNALGRSVVEEIAAVGLAEQIISLGHLSPADVQGAYRAADALIFPSALETAGLPLIEAMEHGLPVLASDLDFARELCGDAAGFFDPRSPDSVADAIVRLRDDAAYRTDLSRRSAERFQGHVRSWDEVLEEVIRIEGLRDGGCRVTGSGA